MGRRRARRPANADLSVTPATERQVSFIYALGREAGLDKAEVLEWSDELFGNPPEQITRRDASALIDALQRKRNDMPAPAEDGKDELVASGCRRSRWRTTTRRLTRID
jgi:hypothetical protein